jgi:PPOX class probable F420-dependent enzyme
MGKQSGAKIPETYMDLFERKAFAFLGTLMPDGSPHVTPVWVMYEAPYVVINSARGRVKDENMERDPRVSLAVLDPQNPYRYVGMQGRVVRTSEETGRKVIDQLAKKYQGVDEYGGPKDEVRVTYYIEPENVYGMG